MNDHNLNTFHLMENTKLVTASIPGRYKTKQLCEKERVSGHTKIKEYCKEPTTPNADCNLLV